MTADQAFANLMGRNALSIPAPGGEREADAHRTEDGSRKGRRWEPTGDEALRVSELLDEEQDDYLPRGGEVFPDRERGGVYDYPTETGLNAMDADEIESAHLHGARILGRDASAADRDTEVAADDAGYPDYTGADAIPDAGFSGSDADSPAAAARLGRARRVRRFSYLPLSGMDNFETGARDLMAGLTALDSDRPSLAITSAVRGEGRTELAIRLALALARRVGYRVLLADFDVRKPQVATRLGVSSKYFTLADVLRGSCPLGEALVASEEDNLYVLPARPSDRDGDEILDSRQVGTLMTELHRTFSFTVFDCGPADHADAVILCRHAGFTALAGFCRTSSASRLVEAGERLEAAGARIAGLIVTGA